MFPYNLQRKRRIFIVWHMYVFNISRHPSITFKSCERSVSFFVKIFKVCQDKRYLELFFASYFQAVSLFPSWITAWANSARSPRVARRWRSTGSRGDLRTVVLFSFYRGNLSYSHSSLSVSLRRRKPATRSLYDLPSPHPLSFYSYY